MDTPIHVKVQAEEPDEEPSDSPAGMRERAFRLAVNAMPEVYPIDYSDMPAMDSGRDLLLLGLARTIHSYLTDDGP